MARRKKSSTVLDKAERRIASLRSISPSLDLGSGLSVTAYNDLIDDVRSKLSAYNTTLSTVDQAYNLVLEAEQMLGDYSERMLLGVGTKYGKGSSEYEMAGGSRKGDRRRTSRSSTSAPAASGSDASGSAVTTGITNGAMATRNGSSNGTVAPVG